MNAIVRIAQLSDCHIFNQDHQALLGLNTLDSFKQVLQMLAEDSFKPDALVLTGDLSQDGSVNSYKKIVACLKSFTCPIYWLPGNHDNDAVMEQVFADHFKSDKSILFANGWQLILLNSHDPGKVTGKLAQKELDYLNTCLEKPDYRYAIIMMHHHPLSMGTDWLEPLGLVNADTLFAMVTKEKRTRAIAWGHVHQAFETDFEGIKCLSAPATSIQFLPQSKQFQLDIQQKPGYRCYELAENGTVTSWAQRLEHFSATYDIKAKGY